MKVLVTGASGFLGRSIAANLAAEGHTLRLALRQEPRSTDPHEIFVIGDLAGSVDWLPLLDGVDAVVHAAGLAHQPAGTSERMLHAVNAEASGMLAAAAARQGIARFIHLSSIRATVGPSSPRPVTEDAVPQPTDAYGRSKLAAEQAITAHLPGAAHLRPVLVAGAGAAGNLASLARLARLPLPLPFGGFRGRRSLTTDRQIADAVRILLASPAETWLRSALVAGPEPLAVPDILAIMRQADGRRPGLFQLPSPLLRGAAGLAGMAGAIARLEGDLIAEPRHLARLGWAPPDTVRQALGRLMLRSG